MNELFNLKDKVALVTGGSGILGREFVKILRSAGAKVAVFELQDGESDDDSVRYFKVDITDKKAITAALEDIKKGWGVPHILVNSAAIDAPPDYSNPIKSGLLESDEAERRFDKVMEVNVKGTLLCSQIIGNEMARSGRGSIINISSIYGEGSPDQRIYIKNDPSKSFIKPISYCVSKGAIPNMSRYLAAYWAGKGVRVNTLTFGGVFNNQDSEFVEKYCAKVPLGRMARKDEYNGALLFLASDASSYMTGSNMVIDGGYTAW
ncbi:MAG: SDR family oxidoreductase [Candidatus Micrarchaeota archaeon]